MTINKSIEILNSHFDKNFTIIYFDRLLPPFKMGKSKFSNKKKKEKVEYIIEEIKSISRNVKINTILGLNNNCKEYEDNLKSELKSIKNNKIESYSSYGRYDKKITSVELEGSGKFIEKVQLEFLESGISIPITTLPTYKVFINIGDVCRFANFIQNSNQIVTKVNKPRYYYKYLSDRYHHQNVQLTFYLTTHFF